MTVASAARQRRSFALIVTLLLVVLLATTVTQLVTATSVEALRVSRGASTPAHELAVDSVLLVAAERLRNNPAVVRDLDRSGHHVFEIQLGDCHVRCRIVNDGAKFDVAAFAADGRSHLLKRKLRMLSRSFGLTGTRVRLRPVMTDGDSQPRRYVWFDQLLDEPDPSALFDWSHDSQRVVWSDVVTCFGGGVVDVRRARPEVLAALFDDVDRSIARKIVTAREKTPDDASDSLRNLLPDQRSEVQSRIAHGLNRYALNIETTIHADRRRWYVVATIGEASVDVHYRGQVRW